MKWNGGRAVIAAALVGGTLLAPALASCGGGDDAASGDTDATTDVVRKEAAPIDPGDTSTPVCAPSLPAGYAPPEFVPPVTTNTACQSAQVQAYYDACFSTTATSVTCTPFTGGAQNAACINCLETDISSSAYGAIIALSNGTAVANISGCIAAIDGDVSSTGCAAHVQAAALCDDAACTDNCVIDSSSQATLTASFNAYSSCERKAATGVCKDEATAAACSKDAKYARCSSSSFEGYLVGIGDLLCASGNVGDGGFNDADASDDASGDASDDASDAADD